MDNKELVPPSEKPLFLLHSRFAQIAAKFPEKIALQARIASGEYKKFTYSRVLGLSQASAAYFIGMGIKRGDRIAIVLDNRPEWPIAYFGILFAGAVAVPIDPQLTEQEKSNLILDSQAKLVIDKTTVDEIFSKLKDDASGLGLPEVGVEETASIIYTSGTTAIPKGVVLSHRNFSANCIGIDQLGIFTANDSVLSILPLHHSYAFTITLLLPLLTGAAITYIKSLKPDEIMSAMKETGVTILVGVPQLFYLFHKGIKDSLSRVPWPLRALRPLIAAKVRQRFGGRLRFFASGGARLDPGVANDLARFGFKILEGYGLTETSPVATFNRPERQKFGSVGLPLPNVEIKIFNPDVKGAGEVLIKGPNVMMGYYKRPEETNEAIIDGWFHSGDLGYLDADGFLFLTGRQKEIIVLSSGKNIYPEEIEAHYKKSLFIKEICVIGTAKNGISVELGAVIVPDTDYFKKTGEINIRDKIKWDLENLSKQLPVYKRIIDFIVIKDELPKTRLGKIKRYEVLRAHNSRFGPEGHGQREAGTHDPDKDLAKTPIGRKVLDLLMREKRIKKQISADDHLELDLGIDSLGRVELAVGLEKAFGIIIPNDAMTGIFTVRDVVSCVNEIIAARAGIDVISQPRPEAVMWKTIINREPEEIIKDRIDLSPGPFSLIVTVLMANFLLLMFRIFFGLKVVGRNNIPAKGPFILCPNHSSYLDAFAITASVPVRTELGLFFLGFRNYFVAPVIKNLIRLMRVVPVDPASELVNAMRASSFIIRHGRSLCIFPEGQRSINGEIKDFKKGIGVLAKELGVKLIPVYIEGAFEAWPRTRRLPRPCPVKIIFGPPAENEKLIGMGYGNGARDDYEAIAIGLRMQILNLRKT